MAYDAYPFERDFGITPDIVKQFVVYLYRHIRERNIPEIESMYEVSFPKLSDRYFKQGPWPHVEAISDLVDQDHVFCLLLCADLLHQGLRGNLTDCTLNDPGEPTACLAARPGAGQQTCLIDRCASRRHSSSAAAPAFAAAAPISCSALGLCSSLVYSGTWHQQPRPPPGGPNNVCESVP